MTIAYMTNGDSTGKVYVINTANDKKLQPTSGITVGTVPYGVAFSPDGSQAVVTNWNHNSPGTTSTISFINTVTSAVTTRTVVGTPDGVIVARSGSSLYAYVAVHDYYGSSGTDFVAVYDMATYNPVNVSLPLGTSAKPYGVTATPDDSYVYVAIGDGGNQGGPGKVTIIQTAATPSIVTTFDIATLNYTSYGIAITPTGSPPRCFVTLLNGSTGNGKVAYFPADGSSYTLANIGYVDVGVFPTGIATDGSTVYVAASNDDRLYYFSASSPPSSASTYISTGASTRPFGVALTPDGSKVYVGASDADKTLVYTPFIPPSTAPSLVTSVLNSGGASFGMFILQNQKANIPFVGGGSSEWFGC